VLWWRDGLPELTPDGMLIWAPPTSPDLFLGLDGGQPRFSAVPASVEGSRAAFGIMGNLSAAEAPVFAAALSLGGWHARHGYCASCGEPTSIVRGGWSRSCPACAAEHYPRVDPVVIMLAEHDGRLLLGRQPQYPPGRYSALAGFVEPGESIEAAVARELGEEAGIAVRDVTYVASQPWPFPSTLMIGASATALSDVLTVDTQELEDARWFTRAEVEAALKGAADAAFIAPPRFAIARTLLDRWARA
jgi:NAD+ diphosphatase